jgi:pyruvate,water dikinase
MDEANGLLLYLASKMKGKAGKLIFRFEELGREHSKLVGKKCANLGEMIRMGLPVPPGFALSIALYRRFAKESGADKEISAHVSRLGELKGQKITLFDKLSRDIRGMIESKEIPEGITKMIASHYEELGKKVKVPDVPVSVRSAGAESRPGMFETYLNVISIEDVLDKIKKVWSSAYTARAIAFRVNKNIPVMKDELGVAVAKMVNARSAGIAFTLDPVTADTSRIVISANWGLGEGVVSGSGSVDRFVVDKKSLAIVESHIGKKARQVINKKRGVGWDKVPVKKQSVPCLSDDEVVAIAKMAMKLEKRLGEPQDMEWVIDADFSPPHNIFLLQTRPAEAAAKKSEAVTDRMIDLISKRLYRASE